MRSDRRLPLLLAAVFLTTACGGPVEPTGMTELRGVVYGPPGMADPPQILAVGLLLVDGPAAERMTASSFAGIAPGTFLGSTTTVADDGGYEMRLPDEDEIPDGILVPAADAIWEVAESGCTLTAEPATVRVSQAGVGLFPVPLLYGFSENGIGPLHTTPTQKLDGVPYEGGYLSWMYADAPVALTTDEACTDLDVALELRRGWNQVRWTPGGAKTLLRDAADDEALTTAIF